MYSAVILSLLGASRALAQSYSLQDTYSGSSFFGMMDFFTGADPTNGFVDYLSYDDAVSKGLISNPSNPAWGVDNTTTLSATGTGRASVRMSSKNSYNHGLFIADIAHMPSSTCGLWPAYWLLGGGSWPAEGELDIIEGVNNGQTNLISGHTSAGCTISNTGTGSMNSGTCESPGSSNTGCSIADSADTSSYGTGFNDVGGGVYAVDWTSSGFQVWFFKRSAIPASISSGNPDPQSDFGSPVATFSGSGCDFDSHFQNMNIVFDTTFCGDWAGAAFSGSCPGSCNSYVAENPSAFDDAYWSINSIKVFQAGSTYQSDVSLSASASSTASSSGSAIRTSTSSVSTTASPSTMSSSTSSVPAVTSAYSLPLTNATSTPATNTSSIYLASANSTTAGLTVRPEPPIASGSVINPAAPTSVPVSSSTDGAASVATSTATSAYHHHHHWPSHTHKRRSRPSSVAERRMKKR